MWSAGGETAVDDQALAGDEAAQGVADSPPEGRADRVFRSEEGHAPSLTGRGVRRLSGRRPLGMDPRAGPGNGSVGLSLVSSNPAAGQRSITELLADPGRPTFSFEFFPPADEAGMDVLRQTIMDLDHVGQIGRAHV